MPPPCASLLINDLALQRGQGHVGVVVGLHEAVGQALLLAAGPLHLVLGLVEVEVEGEVEVKEGEASL